MSAYSDKVIADGAVAYWRLNETSGTTAVDVIGGNNGTISGGVTLNQSGALVDGDKAMTFDGATGTKITAAGIQNYPIGTGPLTFEFWMRTTKPNGGNVFMFDSGSAGGGRGFHVYMQSAGPIVWGVNNGSATTTVNSVQAVNTDKWRYVVGVVERLYDAIHDRIRLFIDGTFEAQIDLGTAGQSLTPATSLFMGAWQSGASPTSYIGSLDEVALYTTALTPTQIAAHYAAGVTTLYPATVFASAFGDDEDDMPKYNIWTPITPSDTVDLPTLTDGVWVGTGGNVAAVMQNNQMPVVLAVPSGAWIPLAARRINATNTTATGIVALYER